MGLFGVEGVDSRQELEGLHHVLARYVGKRRHQLQELAETLPSSVRWAPDGDAAEALGGEHLAVGKILVDDLGPEERAQPAAASEVARESEVGDRVVVEGPTQHVHHRSDVSGSDGPDLRLSAWSIALLHSVDGSPRPFAAPPQLHDGSTGMRERTDKTPPWR